MRTRERGTGVTTARGWPQDSAQAGGMTWGAKVRRAKSGVQEAQKNRSPDRSGPRLACGREPTRLLPVPTICVDPCEPSRTNTWVRRRRDSSPDLSGSSRAGCPITPRRRGTTPDRGRYPRVVRGPHRRQVRKDLRDVRNRNRARVCEFVRVRTPLIPSSFGPHPLSPSPPCGEGGRRTVSSSPSPEGRGGQGVRTGERGTGG